MMKNNHGHIVTVASAAGHTVVPFLLAYWYVTTFLLLTPMLNLYAFMSYYFGYILGNFYIRFTPILYKNKLPTYYVYLCMYIYTHR